MNKLFKYKSFIVGFICGLITNVFVINYINNTKGTGICFYCEDKYAFPFNYVQRSGLVEESGILLVGKVFNILIALLFCFTFGLIFKLIWTKFSLRRSPLK